MTCGNLRVVKVGGSLFDLPDLATRLESWLSHQPPACHVFVAGGGSFADAVRAADERYHLDAAAAHWMCVDGMKITARLLQHLLPDSRLVRRWQDIRQQAEDNARLVLDVEQFLRHVEASLTGFSLPADWTVTSDSIAARVAGGLSAQELVLLKSRSLTLPPVLAAWASHGFVDAAFPQAARDLVNIQWVNLRDEVWALSSRCTGVRNEC